MPLAVNFDLAEIRARVRLSGLVRSKVKLRPAGRSLKGLCPFHAEKSPSFVVSDERGSYHCFGCGARGTVFDWVMAVDGCDFATAVKMLAEDAQIVGDALPPPVARSERRTAECVASGEVADWLWSASVSARRTLVGRYLWSRGIEPARVDAALDMLRFHASAPFLPWGEGGGADDVELRAPAMLGAIVDATGHRIGVHATYLATDGRGKAKFPRTRDGQVPPPRKIWGRLGRGAVWLAGSPVAEGPEPLIVGEGIETCLAFAQRRDPPFRLAAALSLDNLQGGAVLTRDGAIPLHAPLADPARPPFVLRDPGQVILLVDADMKPLRDQKVQRQRGAAWEKSDIASDERTSWCAALARQHWRRAGATGVTVLRPPSGMDFNDASRALGSGRS